MAVQTDASLYDLPARKGFIVQGPPRETLPPKVIVRAPTFEEMEKYCLKAGYVMDTLAPTKKMYQDALRSRLRPQTGVFGSVYLAPTMALPNFQRAAALEFFGIPTTTSKRMVMWTAVLPDNLMQLTLGLENVHKRAMGCSMAIVPPSETFIRVIATYVSLKLSHRTKRSKYGSTRQLHIQSMYVLLDEDGEMTKPKTADRVEVPMTPEFEAHARQAVYVDATKMARAGFPLSGAWLERLGMEFVSQAASTRRKEARMLSAGGVDPTPTPPPTPPPRALPQSPISEQSWSEQSEMSHNSAEESEGGH